MKTVNNREVVVSREARLAEVFVTLADTLTDEFEPIDLLHYLADACVELLDVDAAGIMISDVRGGLKLAASSSERLRNVEIFELQIGEGPCLDAYQTGEPVVNVDLSTALVRWPSFTPLATSVGLRTTHALPLRLRGQVIGAMNLCSNNTARLSESDVRLGQALADMATISLLHDRTSTTQSTLTDQLQAALNNRVVIEQAKGMLAGQLRITPDEAFDIIRKTARSHNNKLLADARRVLEGTYAV